MNTFVKIVGFVALGIGVLIVGGIVLGMLATALKLLVPIAVLAAIGYVAWRVMSAEPAKPAQEPDKKQQIAPPQPEKKALSADEAAKRFEELKKGQSS